jgi:hypothetical protein
VIFSGSWNLHVFCRLFLSVIRDGPCDLSSCGLEELAKMVETGQEINARLQKLLEEM